MTSEARPETQILLACDEPGLEKFVAPYLEGGGLRVRCLGGKSKVLRSASGMTPTVVILDIAPGERRAFELLTEILARTRAAVVLVGRREAQPDLVAGLEVGADDAVAGLPGGDGECLRELQVRLLRILRRGTPRPGGNGKRSGEEPGSLHFAGWRLDLSKRRLISPSQSEILLTTGEFNLLAILSRHAGAPLSREELMRLTRERDHDPGDRTIDIQITRLRRKIETNSRHPDIIKTVRGQGYLFAPAVNPN
jgi:two-component system phosphate regulon response regulator OmpR